MPRYIDRPTPCTNCGGPVQTIVADAPDEGGFVQRVTAPRHAQFPDRGGVDGDCRRAPASG